jgi:hypothetical protein
MRTAAWFYPTTPEEAPGVTVTIQNRNMFFIYQEYDGKKRLQGSLSFPAECAINDTTRTAVTDSKGITITDNGFGGCPIYKGVVPVAAETWKCCIFDYSQLVNSTFYFERNRSGMAGSFFEHYGYKNGILLTAYFV